MFWCLVFGEIAYCAGFVLFFKHSTFVGSAWSFCFFIPATTANDLRLWRILYPRFYPLHLFSYLNSWERASIFPFLMFSAKQGNYWYHFNNVFGMTRSLTEELNPGPPALEASTIPLGYRGGGRWLGIEPGTFHTRSTHSTARLSRRRQLRIIKNTNVLINLPTLYLHLPF